MPTATRRYPTQGYQGLQGQATAESVSGLVEGRFGTETLLFHRFFTVCDRNAHQRLVRFTKDETDNTPSSSQQRAASTPWQMTLLSAETNTAQHYPNPRDPNLSKPSFQCVSVQASRNTCEGLQCLPAAQRWQLVLRSDYHYLLQRGGQRHIAARAVRTVFAVSQHT